MKKVEQWKSTWRNFIRTYNIYLSICIPGNITHTYLQLMYFLCKYLHITLCYPFASFVYVIAPKFMPLIAVIFSIIYVVAHKSAQDFNDLSRATC